MHHELIFFREVPHPETGSKLYLVQFAVDGKPCQPFFETQQNRCELGEDAWYEGMQQNAEGLLRDMGPAPALTR